MRAVPPRHAVASFDSASAFLASLARALQHRDFPYLGQSRLKVPFVYASAALPTRLRRRAYAIASGREGVQPDRLAAIDMEQVAAWVVGRYAARRAPAVLLGSSNGALTHLAAICDIPWLPQTLLIPVRRPGADPEDVEGAVDFGAQHAAKLLASNPGIQLHHMHDPNQDALSASEMAYFRVKWRRLPDAYRRFLQEHLLPGAPVIVVRDTSTWPVTRCGERHVFQFGAQGGMAAAEYAATPGIPPTDDSAAEAEWGLAEDILDPVYAWAAQHGHPVVEIRYAHPQDPAAAVADTVRSWLQGQGQLAERLLVSSFIVHDPWRTISTGSVPFWTFFPVRRAAEDLAAYLDGSAYDDIDIMLFSHGSNSRGLADARTWQHIADRARRRGRLLGVDAAAFPNDFTVFARYAKALRSLPETTQTREPLTIDEALAGMAVGPRVIVHRA